MTAIPYQLRWQGHCLSTKICVADSYFSRLRGLLFSRPLATGSGLLLQECNSIHMFFMTYAIDLAFLNADMEILSLRRSLRPWRMAFCRKASHVLELAVGSIDAWGLHRGQKLELI